MPLFKKHEKALFSITQPLTATWQKESHRGAVGATRWNREWTRQQLKTRRQSAGAAPTPSSSNKASSPHLTQLTHFLSLDPSFLSLSKPPPTPFSLSPQISPAFHGSTNPIRIALSDLGFLVFRSPSTMPSLTNSSHRHELLLGRRLPHRNPSFIPQLSAHCFWHHVSEFRSFQGKWGLCCCCCFSISSIWFCPVAVTICFCYCFFRYFRVWIPGKWRGEGSCDW